MWGEISNLDGSQDTFYGCCMRREGVKARAKNRESCSPVSRRKFIGSPSTVRTTQGSCVLVWCVAVACKGSSRLLQSSVGDLSEMSDPRVLGLWGKSILQWSLQIDPGLFLNPWWDVHCLCSESNWEVSRGLAGTGTSPGAHLFSYPFTLLLVPLLIYYKKPWFLPLRGCLGCSEFPLQFSGASS